MKVAYKTLGCKVNQYETQLIKEQFSNSGFEEVSFDVPADIYVINTCTVTARSDAESRRLIRKAARENPKAKIVVTGCYPELDSGEVEKISDNLLIVKNSEKSRILEYLSPSVISESRGGLNLPYSEEPACISRFEGRTKAFVKAQDGCDNFCSYCKVPLVRGRSRSRPSEEIITEIKQLVSNGYKEIVLTGICLGDWGRQFGLDAAGLLGEIEGKLDGDFRIRLSSIEPWYVTPELIKKIAGSKRICRHLHIPMQSGDDEVLKKMNRNFKAGDFVGLIEKFRSFMPEAAFTTDVLVGFPGETEIQFNNTVKTLESIRPSRAHLFPFSFRGGTAAALFNKKDAVPAGIIRKRMGILKSLTDGLRDDYQKQFLGKAVRVLVETRRDRRTGLLSGFTDTYIKVRFPGPEELKGELTTIVLERQIL